MQTAMMLARQIKDALSEKYLFEAGANSSHLTRPAEEMWPELGVAAPTPEVAKQAEGQVPLEPGPGEAPAKLKSLFKSKALKILQDSKS